MISASPMRILVVTPRVPWPPTDGGRVAMSRLAESLARRGAAVEVLSLNPRKHRVTAEAPLPLRSIEIDTSRRIAPAMRAVTSTVPFIVARFVSGAFDEALRAAVRRFAPDVVQLESPFLLPYTRTVRAETHARIALRSLNVEFRIWEGLAAIEPNAIRRAALRRVASSLRRYELRATEDVDAIIPISAADAADFRASGITRRMHVVPCGVKLDETPPDAGEADTIGFIGSLDFLPNQDAVRWILDELRPRVVAQAPHARLAIAGSAPPDWLQERAIAEKLDLRANVADAAAFVRAQRVVIAPLFAGGGMRIKVLEAMALGKAIVATAIGAGGIDVRNGHDIVIADDAASFANAVVALLRDAALAARIGAAARATVAERYDSDALAADLLAFYAAL
jgi:glycosyltransferase involved in cell wall biosynthesis